MPATATENPWREALQSLRRRKGWTQVEAAAAFGVAAIVWISWENGLRKPGKNNRKRLKENYGICVEKYKTKYKV
jgi:transcriptional regulator with XRE-family HTH domain